jgi:hypothetical protein
MRRHGDPSSRRLIHVPLESRRELLSDLAADLKRQSPLIGLSDTLDTTPVANPIDQRVWL